MPGVFNYPFDFAFFAQKTPRRSPRGQAVEILTAPGSAMRMPVAHLNVNLVMAGTAERHEVVPLMRSAFTDRKYMVHLVHQHEAAFPVTHLTERMLSGIPISDSFPGPPILFVYVGST